MRVSESARRSVLLTGLSYPLLVAGIILLLTGVTVAGAVLLASGVFLIGVNEICLYIARSNVRATRLPVVVPCITTRVSPHHGSDFSINVIYSDV